MKRNINHIAHEIVHQILISELCFGICNSIKIIPDRGNDFLPYYYNLNFTKGLISLHSLLLSQEKGELSIRNYIRDYEWNFPKNDIKNFKKDISCISGSFKKSSSLPLRHKIAAHIDENFKHVDFTRGYIMPKLVPEYCKIITRLKNIFFEFCNYTKNDYPLQKIKQQSDLLLKIIHEK